MKRWVSLWYLVITCPYVFSAETPHNLTRIENGISYDHGISINTETLLSQLDVTHFSSQTLTLNIHTLDRTLTIEKTRFLSSDITNHSNELHTFRILRNNQQPASGTLLITRHHFFLWLQTAEQQYFIMPEEGIDFSGHNTDGSAMAATPMLEARPQSLPKSTSTDHYQTGTKVYRLALTATQDFWQQYHPESPYMAYLHMLFLFHQVNNIYYRDAGIRFQIVTDENALYTNSLTIDDSDHEALLQHNQQWLDRHVGADHYDMGHGFSKTAGGLSFTASVCNHYRKARAVTGFDRYTTPDVAVARLAHEVGHQLGATHTFNAAGDFSGQCRNQRQSHHNRFFAEHHEASHYLAASAYEPGSGSTIMSYAGFCDTQNSQALSDPYLHIRSIEQIRQFIATEIPLDHVKGNQCGLWETSLPAININTGSDRIIPVATPFVLNAEQQPESTTAITYTWEQYDLGDASVSTDDFFSDTGQGPLIMSDWQLTNPGRSVPALNDLIKPDAVSRYRQQLPSRERTLNFRVSARAHHHDTGFSDLRIHVTESAGPFRVQPIPLQHDQNRPLTIQWQVAQTDLAPVHCTHVAIDLSIDGGKQFKTLTRDTVNNGNYVADNHWQQTTEALVRIRCSNNIFFALSNLFAIKPAAQDVIDSLIIDHSNLALSESQEQGEPIIIRRRHSDSPLHIHYAVLPLGSQSVSAADFIDDKLPSGQLTLQVGQHEVALMITPVNDHQKESNEPFLLVVHDKNNRLLASETFTLLDNDSVTTIGSSGYPWFFITLFIMRLCSIPFLIRKKLKSIPIFPYFSFIENNYKH